MATADPQEKRTAAIRDKLDAFDWLVRSLSKDIPIRINSVRRAGTEAERETAARDLKLFLRGSVARAKAIEILDDEHQRLTGNRYIKPDRYTMMAHFHKMGEAFVRNYPRSVPQSYTLESTEQGRAIYGDPNKE